MLHLLLEKRKREHNNANSNDGKERRKAGKDSEDTVESDDDIDQFSFLGKSVLKRASHVSDAEDDSDDVC